MDVGWDLVVGLSGAPGRQFGGLLGAVLGPLGASFGPFGGLLGRLGGLLGASWGLFGASWGLLGAPSGGRLDFSVFCPPLGPLLGPSWGPLGPSWAVLGPSWGRLGPSWSRLGSLLGHCVSTDKKLFFFVYKKKAKSIYCSKSTGHPEQIFRGP